jgi:hypothetical protein
MLSVVQTPNDDLRPQDAPEPEPPFDGAESVWDAALIRLLLETLVREQRLH